MTQFVCPESINCLFDSPETTEDGRWQAQEWCRHLDLRIGDEVWLPDIGWVEKTEPRES